MGLQEEKQQKEIVWRGAAQKKEQKTGITSLKNFCIKNQIFQMKTSQ